jgi:allantoinase
MGAKPADVVRLAGKGRLAVGCDADLSVFAPDQSYVVDPTTLHHKNPITPYAQKPLSGVVRRTFLRGKEADGKVPMGRLLQAQL